MFLFLPYPVPRAELSCIFKCFLPLIRTPPKTLPPVGDVT